MQQVRNWNRMLSVAFVVWAMMGRVAPDWAAEDASQSSREALVLYGDAANFQNNGAFDLAAEEWQKFLQKFPKDPLAAKAQHYLGVCHMQLKHFDQAATAFQAVVSNHPKFEALQDVYLNLGWCQYSLAQQKVEGMHAKAAATFAETEALWRRSNRVVGER